MKKQSLPVDLGQIIDACARVMGLKKLPALIELELRKVARVHLKRLSKQKSDARAGSVMRLRAREHRLLTSPGSKIVNYVLAYPRGYPKLGFDQIKSNAHKVNPCKPSGEAVKVRPLEKPDGGFRPIVKYGPRARAAQRMVADLISARLGHSQFEYARKGRGRGKAASSIINSAKNGGVRAQGTLDVVNCYGSIRVTHVEPIILLPKAVIRNTIFIPDETQIDIQDIDISEDAVRTGLSQGSISSPIVVGKVLEPVIAGIGAKSANSYLDDVCIGEADEAQADAKISALASALSKHPGGALFSKDIRVTKFGSRMNFLGFWFRPCKAGSGNGVRVSPSEKALRRFYIKAASKLLLLPLGEWDEAFEQMARTWSKSYGGLWANPEYGIGISQTVFMQEIYPKLEHSHNILQKHIAASGIQEHHIAYAKKNAAYFMPKCVLANKNGLCEPLL